MSGASGLSTGGALKAYALLTGTMMCWGMNAVLGKLAVGSVSPMVLVSARWLGVLFLIALFLHRGVIRDWPVLKRHLPFLGLMGAIGFTCFNALFYIAAHSTTAINIGILQGAIPIFVMMGAFAVYSDRITMLQMLGVLITAMGVIVVASGGSFERLAALAIKDGDFLMVAACALYACYAVGLRRRPNVPTLSLFAVMAASAFIVSLPFLGVEAWMGDLQWPTPLGWLVILLVTLFPSFLAQIFFIQGVDILGPGRAGVFANLVPIFASFLAVVVLGENFEYFQGAALALVLSGIWMSERFKRTIPAPAQK
jgi:drug/metabolite transporter (DMT)-like permease